MKKAVKLVLITLFCFMLTACGSTPKDYAEKALESGNFSEFMKEYNKADSGNKAKMADEFTKACIDISIKALESKGTTPLTNLNKSFEGLNENKNDSNFNKLYKLKQLVAEYKTNEDNSLKYFGQCNKNDINPYKEVISKNFYLVKMERFGSDYYHMSTGYKSIPNYDVFGYNVYETSRTNITDGEVECCLKSKEPIVESEGLYKFYAVDSGTTKIKTGQGFEKEVKLYTYVPDNFYSVIRKFKYAKNNMDNILKQVKNLPNASVSAAVAGGIRKGVITGNDVNVRKGPGTEYKSLGVFFKGDVLRIVGEERNGSHIWYKIEYDNPNAGLISGYVRSDFINIQ